MKKAIVKQLRRLSAELPQLKQRKLLKENLRVLGATILKEAEKAGKEPPLVEGQPVKEDRWYIIQTTKTVYVPVNHEKNLKEFVKKHGPTAIKNYVAEVNEVVQKIKQREQAEAAEAELLTQNPEEHAATETDTPGT